MPLLPLRPSPSALVPALLALGPACASPASPAPGGAPLSPHASAPTEAVRAIQASLATGDTRLLEQPAVSAEHVAFIYAGDLWVARLDGGDVRRLTTHPGQEMRPRFSPDGRTLSFTGQYDGNYDVYVVPVAGGEPKRMTWHPGVDSSQGFTPDGASIVFNSARTTYTNRFRQLWTRPLAGGPPTMLPLPSAFEAGFSPDGKKLAYTPLSDPFAQWKHYRGGTATRIWVYDFATAQVEQIPQPAGRCNDSDPSWLGTTVYFRSDRDGEFNLYAYDTVTKKVTRLTEHADFPVIDPSTGGGRVVYEQGGALHLYDPAAKKSTQLRIGVAADLIETRPRWVAGAEHVRSADLSPSGARAVFGLRGEIVTVPAEKGDARNLTETPAANERHPAWSPDGKWIAFVSDERGENEIVVAPQDGQGERRRFAPGGAGFYDDLWWSPDGKHLSFRDNARALWRLELESGKATRIDAEPIYGVFPTLRHAWSSDSRWIVYTRMERSHFKRAYLHDVAANVSHPLTDGLSDVSEPVFDAGGKYLYLAASTDAGPFNTWFSQASADIEQTNALYLVTLAKDTPSPFAKESDEEKGKEEDKDETKDEAKENKDEAKKDEPAVPSTTIDLDGLAQRIVAFPLPTGFYSSLRPGPAGKLYYLKEERARFTGEELPVPKAELCRYDLEEREEKVLLAGVSTFLLSRDGKKILLAKPDGWWIVSNGDKLDTSEGQLALDAVRIHVDPRAEWAQIFDEVWRINRDYFYDPGMHGADWPAMKAKYAQFLPHLAVRGDLNRVIRWLCSELAVGHSYSGGGETLVKSDTVPGGLLGADYEVAEGRYRFQKVYGGLNWTPDLRAPLTEPGVDVKAGEFLLAVEGRDLTAADDLFARFENTSGKRVALTVGPSADGAGSRVVHVVPIGDEGALRNRAWVEGNIQKVTEATDGRVAYVYVPNTADLGHVYFKRYFFPQADREAIIVDERHNGGGSIADYYIDILRRPYVAHWTTRYGEDLVTPQATVFGPKVMLIDETAGSGGDLLPWMFRRYGLGKLIGRPTWGGLVGILGFPELMDGGFVTAPNLAFWTEDEGYGVENVGVPPDIEVEQLPSLTALGRDPQLEKAIEVVLEELRQNPPKKAQRPAFPVRVKR
ncbi:MAG TPA: PDZ domain-containing protein [Planctomycetota bacterium]